jgi:hypothetical protein|tara:strand:+ start:382 stop:711 length:330 start_codon:yes stop_codon:yes gene_type:complete
MELLYFVLASYGLTQILLYGSIFNKIRPQKDFLNGFGKLFHCPMCMGFWTGVFLFGINKYTELFTFEYNLANLLILGCLSSGTSYFISVLVNDFGFKVYHKKEGEKYVL